VASEAVAAFGAPSFEGADGKPATREDGAQMLRALCVTGRLPDDGEILIVPGGTILADDELIADLGVDSGAVLHCD